MNKYVKRLLKDTITEIEFYPKSYHSKEIKLVKKSKSVPYGVVGNLQTKILEAAGLDVEQLLKSLDKDKYFYVTDRVTSMLLFGKPDVSCHYLLFTESAGTPEQVVASIKEFLK
jgi:hypothetical protein